MACFLPDIFWEKKVCPVRRDALEKQCAVIGSFSFRELIIYVTKENIQQ